ncbi:MBL fold metallo-hydrolase [Xylanimonas sp. McL0601]|uniref:MBL fold metallo-hydrolase n=1 Tax=Xylanimonas sp. McL0601 TaxID=3414739 RepID=UPI003CF8183A
MRELTEVTSGVWVATAKIWTSNTVVVVDDDGAALVVDPGITPDEVEGLAAAVRAHGWHVTAGLSTHPHWDHVLWSRSLGNVPRLATPRAIAALVGDVERGWTEAGAAAPGHERALFGDLVPLGTASEVPSGADVPLPPPVPRGCRVVVHDAHAPGHLALVTRGVLAAGDMLSDLEVPLLDVGPGGDADRAPGDPLADYRWALDVLERAVETYDVEVLVPGHGSVTFGRDAILDRFAADRAYLRALERTATAVSTPAEAEPEVADPRLADEWVAGEHAAQRAFLVGRRAGA